MAHLISCDVNISQKISSSIAQRINHWINQSNQSIHFPILTSIIHKPLVLVAHGISLLDHAHQPALCDWQVHGPTPGKGLGHWVQPFGRVLGLQLLLVALWLTGASQWGIGLQKKNQEPVSGELDCKERTKKQSVGNWTAKKTILAWHGCVCQSDWLRAIPEPSEILRFYTHQRVVCLTENGVIPLYILKLHVNI